ncbi:3',5'-cyclic AMP phosphodiesterase CpdA [Rhizobiales bacterium GAS191]|nr:3',5'-cyclic AMP phosphodiesterase CpdA [Rhizobiales bacterium GAS191]
MRCFAAPPEPRGLPIANPNLFAISDLHVNCPANRELVEELRPETQGDWLLVAGDVADHVEDVAATLRLLRDRFAKVIWTPGNHELWTLPNDALQLRGDRRYRYLVEICRGLGILTPEDAYPVWQSEDETLVVAPLFLLYDYSLRPEALSKQEALAQARAANVVCADELLLASDPWSSREIWCEQRLAYTRRRLDEIPGALRTVLVSHWPLHPGPTRRLRFPEFALWCGTRATLDWHRRYRAAACIYGHLHIPKTETYDGARFEEVSLGYPAEWQARGLPSAGPLRRIMPEAVALRTATARR